MNSIPPIYHDLLMPHLYNGVDKIIDDSLKATQLALLVLDKCQQQEKTIAAQAEHIETLKSQVKLMSWYIEHGKNEWEE